MATGTVQVNGSLTASNITILQGSSVISPSFVTSTTSFNILGGGPHTINGDFGAAPFVLDGVLTSTQLGGTYDGPIDVDLTSGSVTFSGATLSSAAVLTVAAGAVALNGGLVSGTVQGAGSISCVGANFTSATLNVGNANLADSFFNWGTLTVGAGNTVYVNSSLFSDATVTVAGSVDFVSVGFTGGTLSANQATLFTVAHSTLTGGSITITDTPATILSTTTSASITASGTTILNITSSTLNGASISCADTTQCIFQGTTASSSFNLITSGSATVSSNTVLNLAQLLFNGGALVFSAVVQGGTFAPTGGSSISGALEIAESVAWTSGVLSLSTTDAFLNLTSTGALSFTGGEISGLGSLQVAGQLTCAQINIPPLLALNITVILTFL
jgi:hypothetical protein